MRIYLFDIDDIVTINSKAYYGLPDSVGKMGVVHEQLENGSFDYRVKLDDGTYVHVKEDELMKIDKDDFILKLKVGDKVIRPNGEEAEIKLIDYLYKQVEAEYEDGSMEVLPISKFLDNEESFKREYECEWVGDKMGKFEEIGTEIGRFTDDKDRQYGSSVDATYEIMKVLMERYTYDEEQYLIPKSLLKHILLQVRMMDKQNRIFNNPSGEGDSESPYRDLTGYSLIGVNMVENK